MFAAICCLNTQSKSSHPRPPCFLARSMTSLEYMRSLQVSSSLQRTAVYVRKQDIHVSGEETSRSFALLGGRVHCEVCVPCTSSSLWRRAMLSPNSSFISTKCPARIFSTSLLGMGGNAGDSTNAWFGVITGVGIGVLRRHAMDCVFPWLHIYLL